MVSSLHNRITHLLSWLLGATHQQVRRRLAFRYLRGCGLEIGALHQPLPVRDGVVVEYVDRCSRKQSIAEFPEIDPALIVEPTHIEDGFALETIADASVDFIIANHVLEHSSDTLQTLLTWSSKLAPGGILFVAVPVAEHCFDRGRQLTTLEHFIEDYHLYCEGRCDELEHRNREHYREWITISGPAGLRDKGVAATGAPEDIDAQINVLAERIVEIHFHTFDVRSFRSLMEYCADELDHRLRVLEVVGHTEALAVLQRTQQCGANS